MRFRYVLTPQPPGQPKFLTDLLSALVDWINDVNEFRWGGLPIETIDPSIAVLRPVLEPAQLAITAGDSGQTPAHTEILRRAVAAAEKNFEDQQEQQGWNIPDGHHLWIDREQLATAILGVLTDANQVDDVTRQYMIEIGWW